MPPSTRSKIAAKKQPALQQPDCQLVAPAPTITPTLSEPKTAKAKNLRQRIIGEFYAVFSKNEGRAPTQDEITNHVWEEELAAMAPYQNEYLMMTVYNSVFNTPTYTAMQHLGHVTDVLGVTNPSHRDDISKHISEALHVRATVFWLIGGGFGHEAKAIVPWIGDMVERLAESEVKYMDDEEREELVGDLVYDIGQRFGIKY